MTTAADILRGVPREKLNSPVTDIHIQELASELKNWEELVLYLDLTEAEEEEIRMNYQGRYGLQKREALRKWQQKLGKHGATYRALIVALCCAQQNEMAERVKHLLSKPDKPDASSHVLETFRGYLVDCYAEMSHPSLSQWPFSRMSSYVNLALFEAPELHELPHASQPGMDEQEKGKPKPLKEIKLEELFHVGHSHQAKRKVVLIEGPAGCGKTTLSWHACREWAAGRLFEEFSLLIHVSLEDPAAYEARCLADLIPYDSGEMREAVAKAIIERRGKGVCFLFDAWDEAPRTLHHVTSFLYKFITGASTKMLPRCSIVITSRPVVAALLYPNLTTRVIIGAFNSTSVEEFIDISLGHNSDTKQRLLQALHALPELTSLCSLPINAAIVVHVFQSLDYKLPSTRTGLFHALVCNLLLRHMQLRTDYGLQMLNNFESLPDDISQQFKAVCALAFRGIIEDRRLFELSALKLAHPTSSLGLMQVHQQLTCYGPSHHYSFLHYSVQEFLAAYHISQCSEEEQTKVIGEILHSTPLSLVLPFYAGLTGLATESARNILLEVTKFPLDRITVICDKSFNTSSDKRMLLLALLNCIYESQNPALCRLVNSPTCSEHLEQYYITEDLSDTSIQQEGSFLALTQLKLTPADCLSVGYFILNFHKKIEFNLEFCVGDAAVAIESLMQQLRKPCYNEPGHIDIVLANNLLTDRAMQSISNTLAQTSALGCLSLGGCFRFSTSSDITVSLKYIIEGTSRNSTLQCLDLSVCCLGPEHCYHLALMIAVSNIQHLFLGENYFGSAFHLIVKAAVMHSKIRQLYLRKCCISDRELHSIGIALQGNTSLACLIIDNNLFSLPSLTKFLQLLIFNSGLQLLTLNHSLTDEQKDIVKKINQTRQIQRVETVLRIIDATPVRQKIEDFNRLGVSRMSAMKNE